MTRLSRNPLHRVLPILLFLLAALASGAAFAQPADAGGVQLMPSALADALASPQGEGCQKTPTTGDDPVCVDCTSSEGYCSPGGNSCWNYCQNLVGEGGICNADCNCCVCPDIQPGGDDPWGDGGGTLCHGVCRCDGLPGPQGDCAPGCRLVNCVE